MRTGQRLWGVIWWADTFSSENLENSEEAAFWYPKSRTRSQSLLQCCRSLIWPAGLCCGEVWCGVLVRLEYGPVESGVWKLLFPACICAQHSKPASLITPACVIYGSRNREKLHTIIWGKWKCFKGILMTRCSWFQVLQDLISRAFLAGRIINVREKRDKRKLGAQLLPGISFDEAGMLAAHFASPDPCPVHPWKTLQCWHIKRKYCQA